MNFQDVLILFATIVSTTLGYKVDCPNNGNKCLVCMTPHESAYQDVFLAMIPVKVLELGLDIDSYDSDSFDYGTISKRIKDNVDKETIKSIVDKLGISTYSYPTNIKVVPNTVECPGKEYSYPKKS